MKELLRLQVYYFRTRKRIEYESLDSVLYRTWIGGFNRGG